MKASRNTAFEKRVVSKVGLLTVALTNQIELLCNAVSCHFQLQVVRRLFRKGVCGVAVPERMAQRSDAKDVDVFDLMSTQN